MNTSALLGHVSAPPPPPPPDLVSVSATHQDGGDICGAGGNFIIRIGWVVANAPDGGYQIDIDSVASGLAPSAGFYDHDSGIGPVNYNGEPQTESLSFGPYTVRLRTLGGGSQIESQVTNQIIVNYTLSFCV